MTYRYEHITDHHRWTGDDLSFTDGVRLWRDGREITELRSWDECLTFIDDYEWRHYEWPEQMAKASVPKFITLIAQDDAA